MLNLKTVNFDRQAAFVLVQSTPDEETASAVRLISTSKFKAICLKSKTYWDFFL
jgi:hypothetical protein